MIQLLWIKPRLLFSFYLCLRLTSPNYAFMWRRLYSEQKSSNTHQFKQCMVLILKRTISWRSGTFEHLQHNFCPINMKNIFLNSQPYLKAWPHPSHPWQILEPVHEISNNVVNATSKGPDQPAHMRSLIRAFARRLNFLWVLSYCLKIIMSL